MPTSPQQITREFMDALQLPDHVTEFTLHVKQGEMVTIKCEYYPDLNQDTLITELKEYQLYNPA